MHFAAGFLIAYGLLHLYIFLRTGTALRLRLPGRVLLGSFMLLMIAAPVAVRLLDGHRLDRLARLTALCGFSWMGFLFLFVCTLVVVDCCRCLLYLTGLVAGRRFRAARFPFRAAFAAAFAVSLVAGVYGWFEARDVRLDRVVIESEKIPEGVVIRIAQISDVHLGLLVRQGQLRRIVDVVERARPDLVVSTGDLVDGQMNGLEGLDEPLAALRPRYGKFAVTGNHEYHSDLQHALAFTEKAGFRLLHGEEVQVCPSLSVAGVDDGPPFAAHRVPPGDDLKFLSRGRARFVLLLRHRPIVPPGASALFDLQLSGHVHGGQIFPFGYVSRLFNQYFTGLHRLPARSWLYVTRGAGTWGPPVRLAAPPEVTLIELVHGGGIPGPGR
jgi:uncharacterized protein